jgi:hypothetical protein
MKEINTSTLPLKSIGRPPALQPDGLSSNNEEVLVGQGRLIRVYGDLNLIGSAGTIGIVIEGARLLVVDDAVVLIVSG